MTSLTEQPMLTRGGREIGSFVGATMWCTGHRDGGRDSLMMWECRRGLVETAAPLQVLRGGEGRRRRGREGRVHGSVVGREVVLET